MKRCARCDYEYDDAYDGCPSCARTPAVVSPSPTDVDAALQEAARRLDEVERLLNSSDVYHFKFWSRAFAIVGHNLAAGLAIYIVIAIIGIMLAIPLGLMN